MHYDDLLERTLIAPFHRGCDHLMVASGYATAAFANRHIEAIRQPHRCFEISLFVGMFPATGSIEINHRAFKQLQSIYSGAESGGRFECRYNSAPRLNHSKVYVWLKDNVPETAFVGSANYSANGFDGQQQEVLAEVDPMAAYAYVNGLWQEDCLLCDSQRADDRVAIAKSKDSLRRGPGVVKHFEETPALSDLQSVSLSLIDEKGDVPSRSGLNWGQRDGRNRDQAYIAIPRDVRVSGFFPLIKHPFSVLTDDNEILLCVAAQPKKKGDVIGAAIQTTNDNSHLGRYFRRRLGLSSGEYVTSHHLNAYGRSDVVFRKIDDENYLLEFSKP